ncbi:MAG: SEL1-like repeat protein [Prevotella sp.]|nr:SEL1-like repeat protein [Prevotella sp.]
MKSVKTIFFTILLLLVGAVSSFGQLKFHVASFGEDQFDLAARDERFKKIDGSGSLYAIIKVSGDDLKEYNFNFGNMNHLVESHEDQLWVYVQKNAKHVTITRSGYNPLRNYDLRTTIEAGKTYRMQLSAQGPVIYTQMVMFQTEPKVTGAVVMVQREGGDRPKELFGTTGTTGGVAKSLELGTYTYEMMAENYHSTEGRFTLNNQSETHQEKVALRSNGANITLSVASNADIYVNGEKRGTSSWTGLLRAGNYQVECRQANHKSSSQTITVTEGEDRTVTLTPPTPITGVLAVTSEPLGASIKIDGKDYGTTPRNITDLVIGHHEVTLSLLGYDETKASVEVKENETEELNMSLGDVNVSLKKAEGLYDKKEYSQAVEIFQRLANQGNTEAQYYLAKCYDNGWGISQDYQKSFYWNERAANQGNGKAQNNLGVCYRQGVGVEKDLQKAVYWYEKAANQGIAVAQNNLASCYYNGVGVEKDLQKAVFWFEKAGNQGIAVAQNNLANCYYNGEGVEKDLQKSFYWWEKSANQGNAKAQYNLGICYYNGEGVEKDLQKAVFWFEKAANQGNATAQKNLGLCYENGIGVAKDLQKAAYWKKKYEENPNK